MAILPMLKGFPFALIPQKYKGLQMTKKQPTFKDLLGACIMGALLGAMLAYGLLGGF